MRWTIPAAVGGGAVLGFAVAAYPAMWRDRCLNWGARPGEVEREMAGDKLLPDAPVVSTRAISVDAPPSAIWPWLVQMGPHRGGAYTYDWVENLFGLDMHSADEIMPEFQDLHVGDELPLGTKLRMRIEILEPERAMVMRSDDGAWVWEFELRPETGGLGGGREIGGAGDVGGTGDIGGTTRLISRNRIQDPRAGLAAQVVSMYVMEPGSLIMERKMLIGIKERAERLAAQAERLAGDAERPQD